MFLDIIFRVSILTPVDQCILINTDVGTLYGSFQFICALQMFLIFSWDIPSTLLGT